MTTTSERARAIWHALEPIHAVTYFSRECRHGMRDLGLPGFWMGYFASRAAPMGRVSAGTVEAVFYNFAPGMVADNVPAVWEFVSPTEVLTARAEVAGCVLGKLSSEAGEVAGRLVGPLRRVVEAAPTSGRPLFAANARTEPSSDPVEELWQLTTTLREHRGDGHNIALASAGIDGLSAHVLARARHDLPIEMLRDNRGWTAEEWTAASERLANLGLLSDEGLTAEGAELKRHIEAHTDELAMPPWRVLLDWELAEVESDLRRLAAPVIYSETIPYPNPMGLPRLDT